MILAELELDDEGLPEDFAWALSRWAYEIYLLHERFLPHTIADAWITGLVDGGMRAEHAKAWTGGAKGYPRPLPFVIEFPCPFFHRTEDRYDVAKVRLIVEDNGWVSLDPESPCKECSADQLERWLLTCPRCEAGEVSERHDPEHEALTRGEGEDHDASPVAWVIREFDRLRSIAWARRWVEHYDEAEADLSDREGRTVVTSDGVRMSLAERSRQRAGELLAAVPKKRGVPSTSSSVRTADEAVVWLDAQKDDEGGMLVPEKASQREALRLTEGLPGRPRKNLIEAAQSKRKSRATEA